MVLTLFYNNIHSKFLKTLVWYWVCYIFYVFMEYFEYSVFLGGIIMCLAVPMKIIEMKDDDTGKVEANDVTYNVNLSLIKEPKLGDYVLIHAGFAINKLDEEEANVRIDLFKELAEIDVYEGRSKG
jgi:hydrogenase expression/formation protein HypC